MKSYEKRPVIGVRRRPGAARTVSGTVRKDRAEVRLQYWTEVLERAAGLLGSSGVLSDARTGKGQRSFLVLMIAAPAGSWWS